MFRLDLAEKVYPRVCGGTPKRPSGTKIGKGLSPRVRGNRGNTVTETALPKVYPRVCGGTQYIGHPGAYADGLSPRVRGTVGVFSGG